jgi:hypothetical protein
MFKPILHNLQRGDVGFKEAQAYNRLIGAKPTTGGSLTSKLENIKLWEMECRHALSKVREVLKAS